MRTQDSLLNCRVARLELQVDRELVDVLGHVRVVEGGVEEEGSQHNQDECHQGREEGDDGLRGLLGHSRRLDPGLLHGGGKLGHGGVQGQGLHSPGPPGHRVS